MSDKKSKRVNIGLTEKIHTQAKLLSILKKVTLNDYLRKAIEDAIEKDKSLIKKNGRMKNPLLIGLVMLVCIHTVLGFGAITTESLSPSSITACGSQSTIFTISADSIKSNQNLTNIYAELSITPAPKLTYLTPKQLFLGNLSSKLIYSISWIISCADTAPGTYYAHVVYIQNDTVIASSHDETVSRITINPSLDQSAPVIVSSSPRGTLRNTSLVLNIETNENATCRYDVSNLPYNAMANSLISSGKVHEKLLSNLQDGEYTYYIKCRDIYANINDEKLHTFTIDTSPPDITKLAYPIKTDKSIISVSFSTTENAQCRHSTLNLEFNKMHLISTLYQQQHSASLYPLQNGTNTIYLQCIDEVGNIQTTPTAFTVEVNAVIIKVLFNATSSLKPGLTTIKLVSSEHILNPKLSYTLSDGSSNEIALSGNRTEWEGKFLLPDTGKISIGQFLFEGADSNGNLINTINEGNIFIIDPIAPRTPSDFSIKRKRKILTLSWNKEDEDAKNIVIYRSLNPDVSFLDYHDETTHNAYDDEGDPQVTYYYKIAAKDAAGNLGELSKLVAAGPYGQSVKQTDTIQLQNSETKKDISQDLEKLENEADKILSHLLELRKSLRESVGDFYLVLQYPEIIRDANKNVIEIKNKMEELYETHDENILKELQKKLDQIKSVVPKTITETNKNELLITATEEDLASFKEFIEKNIGNQSSDKEISRLAKIQEKFIITLKYNVYDVQTLDGAINSITVVQKIFSSEENFNLFHIIENPGDFLVKTSPVASQKYEQYHLFAGDQISNSIIFVFNKELSEKELKSLTSLIYPKLFKPAPITGLSVIPLILSGKAGLSSLIALFSIVLVIIGVYAGIKTGVLNKDLIKKDPYLVLLKKAHEEIDSCNYAKAYRTYMQLLDLPLKFRSRRLHKNLYSKLMAYHLSTALSKKPRNEVYKEVLNHYKSLKKKKKTHLNIFIEHSLKEVVRKR